MFETENIENFIDEEMEIEEMVSNEELEETAISEKYINGQFKIVRSTMDFPLNNLLQTIEDKDYLTINPSYQRRNRWDRKKKSLLIESLIMNVPIPPIFLYERDYNSYEVMDGLQRLTTISEFLKNGFKLTSLQYWHELNGKYFKDLPDVLKRGLFRRTISAIVLLAESSREIDNTDVRMILFNRLNTGGIQLNPQELRNALYPGAFNDMIIKLSREDIFTNIWKIPKWKEDEEINPSDELVKNNLYKTMGDCEIVLRFFAIRDAYVNKHMTKVNIMLDNCMKMYCNMDKENIAIMEKDYLKCLEDLKNIFNENLFYLPKVKKLSIPMYDAFMIAYSLIDDKGNVKEFDIINERLKEALNNEEKYKILTGKLSTSQSICDRIDLAREILVGE